MTKTTLSQMRQNKMHLIVDDLMFLQKMFSPGHLKEDDIYAALLRRGVFKWLAARRQVIRLKDQVRRAITKSLEAQVRVKRMGAEAYKVLPRNSKFWGAYQHNKGYMQGMRQALQMMLEALKTITHGSRWQAADNDWKAQEWLRKYEQKNAKLS